MNTLGERIKLARGGRSQESFAKQLNISKGSLGFYERNENLPNVDIALKICSETGVDLTWLLTGQQSSGSDKMLSQETNIQLGCAQCLSLYAKLDEARRETIESMRENARLTKELDALKNGLSAKRNGTTASSA